MKRINLLHAIGALLLAVPVFGFVPVKTSAQVPFEFEVGGQVLPAGKYYFETASQNNIMTIRDENGRVVSSSIVSVADKAKDQRTGVSFRSANGRMRLKELRLSRPESGVTLRVR